MPSIRIRAERDRLAVSANAEVAAATCDGSGVAVGRWAKTAVGGGARSAALSVLWCTGGGDPRGRAGEPGRGAGGSAGRGRPGRRRRTQGSATGRQTRVGVDVRAGHAGRDVGSARACGWTWSEPQPLARHPDWLVEGADAGRRGQDFVLDVLPGSGEHLTGVLTIARRSLLKLLYAVRRRALVRRLRSEAYGRERQDRAACRVGRRPPSRRSRGGRIGSFGTMRVRP